MLADTSAASARRAASAALPLGVRRSRATALEVALPKPSGGQRAARRTAASLGRGWDRSECRPRSLCQVRSRGLGRSEKRPLFLHPDTAHSAAELRSEHFEHPSGGRRHDRRSVPASTSEDRTGIVIDRDGRPPGLSSRRSGGESPRSTSPLRAGAAVHRDPDHRVPRRTRAREPAQARRVPVAQGDGTRRRGSEEILRQSMTVA